MSRSNQTMGAPPSGVSAAEWLQFHKDIATARKKLDTLAGAPAPGSLTGTGAEDKLADAASAPDYHEDDTHLFVKPGSVLGLGTASKVGDEIIKTGAAVVLIPIICVGSCFASFLGFGGDDTCKKCVENAKNLADDVPGPGDVLNLIPGVGDITSSQFTGLWHFVNMSPSPLVQNQYDDHQGMLYEVAGPYQVPGGIDIAIMAGCDIAGLSVNPDKSDGVKRYEIASPGDSYPDGDIYNGSVKRGGAAWQKYPMGHTAFSPVDNLALYGWQQFRDQGHDISNLGFPLHALGDATVPMHVTGTTGWGHRPFEEAQEQLWNSGALTGALSNERILKTAFGYRQEILKWRVSGHANDMPIRHLVRSVARHTYDYSQKQEMLTLASTPTKPWPFNDAASTLWHTFSENEANSVYRDRSDAVKLVVPLIEDGIAAQIAILTSATEANGIVRNAEPPVVLDAHSYQARRPGGGKPTAPSAAEEAFADALRMDYARLAQLLITNQLTPAQYLQRVRDRSRKARLAAATPGYYEAFAKGDTDGDLIPNDRDASKTAPLAPTDDRGNLVRDTTQTPDARQPKAAGTREMQNIFAHMGMMIAPKCANQPAPTMPRLQQLGYSSQNRDLMFAVTPVAGADKDCPVFYEFAVRLTEVFPGNASFLPAEAYKQVVFRSDQNADKNPTGKNRLVFRILRNQTQTGDRDFLLQHVARYGKAEWRARAINANGMSSDWSQWQKGADPISFGEP